MDDRSPLLIHRYSDSADLPNPNLRPRHRELIPTPCGPIKPWSELSCLVKVYYCLTIVSLLAVLAVTAVNIYKQIQDPLYHEDFTISLIQLVGILFCCYYVTRGILQENRQELIVFVASVVLVMMRSVVNFAVLPAPEKDSLILVRFVCIMCIGLFHVICSTLLIRSSNMMAFRVGGALESLQEQYFLLNVCFSMVTFDLQAQICLCILVLTSGIYHISFSHSIILGFGIFWACLTSTVGVIAVLKELKPLVWVFVLQNLPEVAYLIFLLYQIIKEWGAGGSYALEAAAITGSIISVVIKGILFWSLTRLYRSFGQGLRERMFASEQ
ncbi:hypothetical protein AOXY_G22282 [Acipenser oxyrinchus oxyrinchus]|uniref:DUF7789 domain-containing protein n=1 Tax=Acipenser oxyrinchus oxyrinchus TaxID=40147 RepID=A0AAD8CZ20_ACIOX|nr:hypothetical protein AOXY_G22282 [Acipenser oxyrinchus oxyrinchus]